MGLDLAMSVGAIAMNLSTVIVAVNTQLLRGAKLGRDPISQTVPAQKLCLLRCDRVLRCSVE